MVLLKKGYLNNWIFVVLLAASGCCPQCCPFYPGEFLSQCLCQTLFSWVWPLLGMQTFVLQGLCDLTHVYCLVSGLWTWRASLCRISLEQKTTESFSLLYFSDCLLLLRGMRGRSFFVHSAWNMWTKSHQRTRRAFWFLWVLEKSYKGCNKEGNSV